MLMVKLVSVLVEVVLFSDLSFKLVLSSNLKFSVPVLVVSPAKQKRYIGIAFPASSSAAAAFVLASFLVKLCFSGTIRAKVMKLGASIHLVK